MHTVLLSTKASAIVDKVWYLCVLLDLKLTIDPLNFQPELLKPEDVVNTFATGERKVCL